MAKDNLKFFVFAMAAGLIAAPHMKAVTVTTDNWGTLAGNFTSIGTLPNQGTALEASFALSSAAVLKIYTNSYGGGTNANGSTTMAGGFMPSLVLYDGSGNYMSGQIFPSPIGNMDPATKLNGDSYIQTSTLAAGNYILALSDFLVQQPPTATNLSDGFVNFGSGTTFTDVQGNPRSGNFALNITGATGGSGTPAVPEPATMWLTLPVLSAAGLWMKKRKATA